MPFTPHNAGSHAIGRARQLFDASVSQKQLPISLRLDMRRLSVVMAVAALDTYLHRLVVERAYTHAELPKALAKLDLPFALLLEQADMTKEAAHKDPHNPRPRVGVKRQLRNRLLRVTFQRFEDVGDALSMAGRSGAWSAIGQRLTPVLTPNQIQARLNAIVTRRNQIVHEGDYERLERPRGSYRNSMPIAEARADITFLGNLIEAIHEIVSSPHT